MQGGGGGLAGIHVALLRRVVPAVGRSPPVIGGGGGKGQGEEEPVEQGGKAAAQRMAKAERELKEKKWSGRQGPRRSKESARQARSAALWGFKGTALWRV